MRMATLIGEKMVSDPSCQFAFFSRALSEKKMSSKTYFEKLRDPRWQKKRLEVMERANFCCEICYGSTSTLNVHHKFYFKGREPWEYDEKQLSVLCEMCHEETHGNDNFLKLVASYVDMDGPYSDDEIGSLIAGYIGLDSNFELMPHIPLEDGETINTAPDRSMESYYLGRLADAVGNHLPWNKYTEIHKTELLRNAIWENGNLFSEMLNDFMKKVSSDK